MNIKKLNAKSCDPWKFSGHTSGAHHRRDRRTDDDTSRTETYLQACRAVAGEMETLTDDELVILRDMSAAEQRRRQSYRPGFSIVPFFLPDHLAATDYGGVSFSKAVRAFAYSLPAHTCWLFSYLLTEIIAEREDEA